MRVAFGAVLVVVGLFLLVLGVIAMTTDTYDTTRTGHVVVGLMWALPGLAMAAAGLWLILGGGRR